MESRLKACTGPHGRWHKAVQDRPPPWLPLPKRPQLPQFAASWLLTCRTGIHPTVAEFEPEWLGGQTGGWDASRGKEVRHRPHPGGHWKLGSFQCPLGSGNADPVCGEPTKPWLYAVQKRGREAATEASAPHPGTSQSLGMMSRPRARKGNSQQYTNNKYICIYYIASVNCGRRAAWRAEGPT